MIQLRTWRSLGLGLLAIAGVALAVGVPNSESVSAQAVSSDRYTGVASCAGSTCHGRAEGNGEVVRQDEIASWQEPSSAGGAHSRALAIIKTARGRKITDALGLKAPGSEPACLGCHSTFVAVADRGPRFQVSDGIGCESCHGPAQRWLASHYTKDGSHSANVGNGLIPLENPQTRAGVCLDCHYGSADGNQFVTHSMMAAGHPRVSFELDLFSSLQQHHDFDEDYRQRKGGDDSVRLWAVGQAEAVRRATGLFARPDLGTDGAFPEFYFYDCHSCHRAIADGPKQSRTFQTNPGRPIPFGQPPFNDENIIMLSAVSKVLAPAQADGFEKASRNFHGAMGQGREQAVRAAGALRTSAAKLSSALAARSYGSNDAFTVIRSISARATSARFTDYSGSVQAVMGIDTLLNSLVRNGQITVGASAGIRANLNRAYQAVSSPESYNPDRFRTALAQAARAIGSLS